MPIAQNYKIVWTDSMRDAVMRVQYLMRVNTKKCIVITLPRKRFPIIFNCKLNYTSVSRSSVVCYLGVYIDCKLTFREHFEHMISKANHMLGFMLRVANNFKDCFGVKALYCAIFRPILEFACINRHPSQRYMIDRIESIQHKVTRFMFHRIPWSCVFVCPSYRVRCLLFRFKPLECRTMAAQCLFFTSLFAVLLTPRQFSTR